jgi:ketosteroid isomerase-like protein
MTLDLVRNPEKGGIAMRARPAFLLGTIFLISGCGSPPEVPFDSAAQEEIRRVVEGRVLGYVQAMKDMDGDYMFGFFADSEDFVFDDYGTPPIGYADYTAGLQPIIESGAEFTKLEIGEIRTVVLGPTAASCSLEAAWTMVDANGGVLNAKGGWAYVFKEFNGVWQVVHSTGMHLYEGPDGVWVPNLDF